MFELRCEVKSALLRSDFTEDAKGAKGGKIILGKIIMTRSKFTKTGRYAELLKSGVVRKKTKNNIESYSKSDILRIVECNGRVNVWLFNGGVYQ